MATPTPQTRPGQTYDEATDRWYPTIDTLATYRLVNPKNTISPPITIRNEAGTQIQSLTLAAHESLDLSGNRMTKYVFELERRGEIRVENLGMLPS